MLGQGDEVRLFIKSANRPRVVSEDAVWTKIESEYHRMEPTNDVVRELTDTFVLKAKLAICKASHFEENSTEGLRTDAESQQLLSRIFDFIEKEVSPRSLICSVDQYGESSQMQLALNSAEAAFHEMRRAWLGLLTVIADMPATRTMVQTILKGHLTDVVVIVLGDCFKMVFAPVKDETPLDQGIIFERICCHDYLFTEIVDIVFEEACDQIRESKTYKDFRYKKVLERIMRMLKASTKYERSAEKIGCNATDKQYVVWISGVWEYVHGRPAVNSYPNDIYHDIKHDIKLELNTNIQD